MTCMRCTLRFTPTEPVVVVRRRRRATEPPDVAPPPAAATGRGFARPLAVVTLAFAAIALALEMQAWPEALQLVGLLVVLVARRVSAGDQRSL